jgi:hypothetical protein
MSMILLTRMLNNPCPKSDQKIPQLNSTQITKTSQSARRVCLPGCPDGVLLRTGIVHAGKTPPPAVHRLVCPDAAAQPVRHPLFVMLKQMGGTVAKTGEGMREVTAGDTVLVLGCLGTVLVVLLTTLLMARHKARQMKEQQPS